MKRYTETEKWSLPWFRKASVEAKCLWHYINDRCDKAGVWIADWELASFQVGATVGEHHLAEMEGSILNIGGGRMKVSGFVEFQYKRLSECSPPHQEIIELVAKHRAATAYDYDAQPGATPQATPAEPTTLFPVPAKVKPPKDASPARFTFWCGAKVTEETLDRLVKNNPGVDVEREIERAMDWAKGKGRKTKSVFLFLDNWLGKKQQDNQPAAPASDPLPSTDQCLALGMDKAQINELIATRRCAPWPSAS